MINERTYITDRGVVRVEPINNKKCGKCKFAKRDLIKSIRKHRTNWEYYSDVIGCNHPGNQGKCPLKK